MASYLEILENASQTYTGLRNELITITPKFFKLIQDLYGEDIDWKSKFKINCCLAHFSIISNQQKSESINYIEGLYLCAYVLNQIYPKYSDLIEKNWDNGGTAKDAIANTLKLIEDTIVLKKQDLLVYSGLNKFDEMSKDKDAFKIPSGIDDKLDRIYNQNLDLMVLLHSVFYIEGTKPSGRRLRDYKELFSKHEWERVIRIIQNIEMHESRFDNSHEIELEKIKRRVILEMDDDLIME